MVIAAPGAGGGDLPAGLVGSLDIIKARGAVTPGIAREQRHRLQCLAAHRQGGRRSTRAEAVEEEQVGADHAVGAVGDRDCLARTLDRGDSDAPVGGGEAARLGRRAHPVEQHHPAQQHPCGQHEGERHDRAAGGKPQHQRARDHPAAEPGEQADGRQRSRALGIIGGGRTADLDAGAAGHERRAPWAVGTAERGGGGNALPTAPRAAGRAALPSPSTVWRACATPRRATPSPTASSRSPG